MSSAGDGDLSGSVSEDVRAQVQRFANLVKKFGFDMENRMLGDIRNRENPRVAFLFEEDGPAYKLYRQLAGPNPGESEARKAASSADESAQKSQPASTQSSGDENRRVAETAQAQSVSKKRRFSEAIEQEEVASKVSIDVIKRPTTSENEGEEPLPEETTTTATTGAAPRVGGYGRHIPKEVLDEFMAKSRGEKAPERKGQSIDESNVGHQMLAKMGWKQGSGLGSKASGSVDIVKTSVKMDKAGVGADGEDPADVKAEDDMFAQYRKRMMLAYRYRPNPLNNPRRAYDGYNPGGSK